MRKPCPRFLTPRLPLASGSGGRYHNLSCGYHAWPVLATKLRSNNAGIAYAGMDSVLSYRSAYGAEESLLVTSHSCIGCPFSRLPLLALAEVCGSRYLGRRINPFYSLTGRLCLGLLRRVGLQESMILSRHAYFM